MAAGFFFVAYSARVQYRREGSATAIFNSITLEETLQRIRAEYGSALDAMVDAMLPIARGRLGRPVEFGYKAQVVDNEDGLVLDHGVVTGNRPTRRCWSPLSPASSAGSGGHPGS